MEALKKRALTFEEGCELTGFARSYMYKLTASRKIPHSKPLGGAIFFDREALESWLLSNPKATREQQQIAAATYTTTHK